MDAAAIGDISRYRLRCLCRHLPRADHQACHRNIEDDFRCVRWFIQEGGGFIPMSNDLLTGISMFFSNTWRFFSETTIPGTTISVAALYIGMAVILVAFQLLSIVLGHSVGDSDDGSFGSYGSRSSKKAKISDKRKNDTR